MSRRLAVTDRLVVGLIALVLLAGGVLTALWGLGRLPGAAASVDLAQASGWTRASWWSWAAGGSALLLVVVGVGWLLAHLRRGGPTHLTLPGSGRGGHLGYDVAAPAAAAAQVLAQSPDVLGARSGLVWEGGRPVVELRATISPRAALADVDASVREVAAGLAAVTGPDVPLRVRVTVPRRRRGPRVLR